VPRVRHPSRSSGGRERRNLQQADPVVHCQMDLLARAIIVEDVPKFLR
jgi:hypothetical protein